MVLSGDANYKVKLEINDHRSVLRFEKASLKWKKRWTMWKFLATNLFMWELLNWVG